MLGRDLDLEFEVPFRELTFDGVPHREAAKMLPTVNCLVELQQVPPPATAAARCWDRLHLLRLRGPCTCNVHSSGQARYHRVRASWPVRKHIHNASCPAAALSMRHLPPKRTACKGLHGHKA